MYILGINEDQFDGGVALCDGERVLFAANEERYSRRKNEGGFPRLALEALFDYTGVAPDSIDRVCISGIMTPPFPVRVFPRLHDWLYNTRRGPSDAFARKIYDAAMFLTPVTHTRENASSRRLVRRLLVPNARRTLPRHLRQRPITFFDHHTVHVAGAWQLSGRPDVLCVTADGMGDGLSATVAACRHDKGIRRIWEARSWNSFGMFFEALTEAMGFTSHRDEGKLTGLAATGDPNRVDFPSPFHWEGHDICYTGHYGIRGIRWARKELLEKHSREDVAAWAQHILETYILDLVRRCVRETGLRTVALAGGIFANVKLNQHIHQLDEVEHLFVFPNMGDGGLALGCCCLADGLPLAPVHNVFWGDGYEESDLEAALRRADLAYTRMANAPREIAECIAAGNLVARFDGRMEWGPRALGNRSVLALTTDAGTVARLNGCLRRNDFMPFAPAVLHEDAAEFVVDFEKAQHAAEFMTTCFRCTEMMQRQHKAVVHVDGTARAQFVRKDANPAFHAIIESIKELTGAGIVLNTSFNIHEEPIVRTPDEAIIAFRNAGLDYLALGPFLVRQPETAP